MRKTYAFKVFWYDDYSDTEKNCCAVVGAESYAEAMTFIEQRFANIYHIEITELFEHDGFYFFEGKDGEAEYNRLVAEEMGETDDSEKDNE